MDIHQFEVLLNNVMLFMVLVLDIFGAIVVIYGSIITFIRFIRSHMGGREIRLTFARYLVLGLEFKLAGEILRTMVVRTFDEIIILSAIILLRAILYFIIHWEMRQEESS